MLTPLRLPCCSGPAQMVQKSLVDDFEERDVVSAPKLLEVVLQVRQGPGVVRVCEVQHSYAFALFVKLCGAELLKVVLKVRQGQGLACVQGACAAMLPV